MAELGLALRAMALGSPEASAESLSWRRPWDSFWLAWIESGVSRVMRSAQRLMSLVGERLRLAPARARESTGTRSEGREREPEPALRVSWETLEPLGPARTTLLSRERALALMARSAAMSVALAVPEVEEPRLRAPVLLMLRVGLAEASAVAEVWRLP